MYDPDETGLVLMLAKGGGCSLESKKGDNDNWIERAGGSLPNYVCKVAKGIMRSGRSKSSAIAMAISQIKRWAAGGEDVEADTRAKAAKALAQWEALKAKAKAKRAVKATNDQGGQYLFFANSDVPEFSVDVVRQRWEAMQAAERRRKQEEYRREHPEVGNVPTPDIDMPDLPYFYIVDMWTSHLIVEANNTGRFLKVPYEVRGDDVFFGPAQPVIRTYEEVPADITVVDDEDLSDYEIAALSALSAPVGSPLGKILSLTQQG